MAGIAQKYVVVYAVARFDFAWGESPEEAAAVVRSTLKAKDFILAVYPLHGPVPPELEGFPRPYVVEVA